ncbi:MAG: divalent-cation tolerance protein CutA [Elainellaceae cyanobacterium]
MDTALIAIWVTAASEEDADAIATALVEQRLAACVTIAPIRSIYRWQGTIERSQEWQLTIKTTQARFAAVEAAVQRLHPYDVPEVLAAAISDSSSTYATWLVDQVT